MNENWTLMKVRRGFESIKTIYDITVEGGLIKGFIAGSYAAFMASEINPVLPNDIDIFATSDENAVFIRDQVLLNIPLFMGMGYSESAVAYTIEPYVYDPEFIRHEALGIQIVKPHPDWENLPTDMLDSFDLDISRAYLETPEWVRADRNVGLHRAKLLKTNDPLRSLKRMMKYNARGVEFSDHELLKLFRAWESMTAEKREKMIAEALQAEQPIEIVVSDGWNYDEDDYFSGE